jgi:hypothetical protein
MSKTHSREVSLNMPSETEPVIVDEEPTKKEPKKLGDYYNNFMTKLEPTGLDLYMLMEFLVFFLSFWFLVGDDVRGVESMYLYMLNGFLVLDFFFRMLSLKIESVKREYWNHTLHCVLPLVMWLLAAFYKFDEVFGSNAIKVLNALLFAFMNLFVLMVILFKYLPLDKMCKKKETEEEQVDLELGN